VGKPRVFRRRRWSRSVSWRNRTALTGRLDKRRHGPDCPEFRPQIIRTDNAGLSLVEGSVADQIEMIRPHQVPTTTPTTRPYSS
jgi:hypothetical protein